MKSVISTAYDFNPSAHTLNLSSIPGFSISHLYAVINQTRGTLLFAAGTTAYGYSSYASGVITLTASMNGMVSTDDLMIIYDSAPVLPAGSALAANQPALNGDGGALSHVTNFPTTITANAGNNLNTSALALESGGNLSAINAKLGGTLTIGGNVIVSNASEIGGNSTIASASIIRPTSGTATYTAGKLIANDPSGSLVIPCYFVAAKQNGGSGRIARIRVSSSNTLAVNAVFRVHLFKTPPTTTVGDAGVFAGAVNGISSNYIGSFDVITDKQFSDGVIGNGLPNIGTYITFVAGGATQNIYGLLEARSPYTAVAGETYTIYLEVDRD